jgi:hypothetical protein
MSEVIRSLIYKMDHDLNWTRKLIYKLWYPHKSTGRKLILLTQPTPLITITYRQVSGSQGGGYKSIIVSLSILIV